MGQQVERMIFQQVRERYGTFYGVCRLSGFRDRLKVGQGSHMGFGSVKAWNHGFREQLGGGGGEEKTFRTFLLKIPYNIT